MNYALFLPAGIAFLGVLISVTGRTEGAQAVSAGKFPEQTAAFRTSVNSKITGDRNLADMPPAVGEVSWRLVGTAVTGDPRTSFAIIEINSTGRQGACREGDRIGDVLIKKILDGKVTIATSTGEQMLIMGSGGNRWVAQSSPQMPRINRREVDNVLPEYMQLMREIRVRPYLEAGRPGGILIYNIEEESIFARMGLENGDVIMGLNGKPITRTQQAVELYDALKKGGMIVLKIKRAEGTKDLNFKIQ